MRALWCSLVVVLCAASARADIAVQQVGFADGDDWEGAIAADGQYVYAFWPHYAASVTQPDSSGATCAAGLTSYMFFQRSTNGGTTWDPFIIPRCPVGGHAVDAQVVVGPNHRVYAAYMDGPQANTPIMVIYSDDHGTTWSVPVNAATGGTSGDKPLLLVESNGGVHVAFENNGTNYVSYSPNVATTAFTVHTIRGPAGSRGVALNTGGALDTHGNAYFVLGMPPSNSKGDSYIWITRSSDHWATYTSTMVDRSFTQPVVSGAGWDFFGASISLAVIPRAGQPTDRLVVVYNAGKTSKAPERIFTKHSDTNGASWNIPYNASSYPNGTELSAAPTGTFNNFPTVIGTAAGVKTTWLDNRTSPACTSATTPGACGRWNVYTRTSSDGVAWGVESKMVLPLTHTYQTASPSGFFFPYGDYGWLAVDGLGNTWAIWGEGASYPGPGTLYVAKY